MPEPQPCPNCGGIHEPGACPTTIEVKKEKTEFSYSPYQYSFKECFVAG